jgi:RimJ/RimL family protein N-acetyltransferase
LENNAHLPPHWEGELLMAGTLPTEIRTTRLLLRRWQPDDVVPFCQMNSAPKVMEFFPASLSEAESLSAIERMKQHFELHGFGMWAVEIPGIAPFIGSIGLRRTPWAAPFTPCVEVGWRLAAGYWGQGYALEAAHASLDFAFQWLNLDEVVAFTVPANRRSRSVMERLGMTYDPNGDFDHPMVPEGHALKRHILYRISRATHLEQTK